ncbi:hypothetical protein FQR65_LT07032 [Abscondita terminalis]|nr:hypothetical protein FQR65_LT07032 [Abscondita terminalis]
MATFVCLRKRVTIICFSTFEMATKFSKRGKNPGAVDAWLDSLGYYRKNVAYDETCLFRAVAEQLFYSQLYHEKVRKECIAYGKKYCKEFKNYYSKKRDWWEHLKRLNLHMQICGDIEIQLICNAYRIDVSIYNANDHNIKEFSTGGLNKSEKTILLCKMNEDHYDSVYDKQYISNAGFCQSLVYNLLYEDVFQIPNVSSIVKSMLHEKQPIFSIYQCESGKDEYYCEEDDEERENNMKLVSSPLGQGTLIAPFPFKVAKALDPNMYRNIEYDTWLEVRRAMRLGDWYYGDDKLILGTRCNVDVDGIPSPCYIQEILKDDRCVVYVTNLAERLTVNYSDLKPEDNAKPWPLPYRFIRKVPIQPPNELAPLENEQFSLRKRREKNRNNNNLEELITKSDLPENELNSSDYKGCNLLIQDVPDSNLTEKNLAINITNSNLSLETVESWSQGDGLSLNWCQSPTTIQTDSNPSPLPKVQVPSGQEPVRNESYFYNYDHEVSYSVPVWIPHSFVVPTEHNTTTNTDDNSYSVCDSDRSQNCVYYQVDNMYGQPTLLTPPISNPSPSITPFSPPITERFVCSTPVAPISPHCDPYSFVYPVATQNPSIFFPYPPHPFTPVTPRPPEVLTPLRSPVPIYGNPNEIQYTPSTYVCPPQTPPVAWFNPNVNAQGFIFPPPPAP